MRQMTTSQCQRQEMLTQSHPVYDFFFDTPTVRPRRPVVFVCCPRTRSLQTNSHMQKKDKTLRLYDLANVYTHLTEYYTRLLFNRSLLLELLQDRLLWVRPVHKCCIKR